jgi:hypothetical protein
MAPGEANFEGTMVGQESTPTPELKASSAEDAAGSSLERTAHSQFYTGIRNGLWERKHSDRMGQAVWLFGWLIGRQNGQNGGAGIVLRGRAISWDRLAELAGWPVRTLKRWAYTLQKQRYIKIESQPGREGVVFQICNAKKFSRPASAIPQAQQSGAKYGTTGAEEDQMWPESGARCGTTLNKGKKAREESKRGDPRFQLFLDCAFQAYKDKLHDGPSWTGEDFRALKELLQANHEITLQHFQGVFHNYLSSTKSFYREKGWRLKYACTDFDGLRGGPIHDRGESNGNTRKEQSRSRGDLSRFKDLGQPAGGGVAGNPR